MLRNLLRFTRMDNRITVYGSTGFIGSRFCQLNENNVIKNKRDDYVTKSNEILYFISTVDNYNIHQNLEIDIDTNLKTLMKVLGSIDQKEDVTFNFISSWFVYGKNYNIPFREDDTHCNPTGFYSITKRCAEQLLISFCETHGIKYRIFRLANVLGPGDKKISKKKNALQFLINEIVNDRDIPLYYGGEVLRDYIHVDDVCSAISHCMRNAPFNEIINIGSGRPYRFLDMINKAVEYSNSKSKIVYIDPTKFHDIVQIRHSYLNTSKLNSYGFKQEKNMDEVIEELVDFYRMNKE